MIFGNVENIVKIKIFFVIRLFKELFDGELHSVFVFVFLTLRSI